LTHTKRLERIEAWHYVENGTHHDDGKDHRWHRTVRMPVISPESERFSNPLAMES
jgi:hypothetical protein